jgi:hypothetical protein
LSRRRSRSEADRLVSEFEQSGMKRISLSAKNFMDPANATVKLVGHVEDGTSHENLYARRMATIATYPGSR